ncbi:hypothetical protein [Streptococcus cuniculi]|uniref:DUF5648 domain-containing protein n=1 Tax=Streptococcus cuniculi TaxID=1432788 RepID=A0A4Y9JAU6_9STRE|nr:hypothetical protein [Streptococcus cuniculi]MBF0778128.1 hypothetical protein [Streptococcus cuniculi]TFU98133.1 hypothetical protein E4T82_05260 [Streptococcus cuniculi]
MKYKKRILSCLLLSILVLLFCSNMIDLITGDTTAFQAVSADQAVSSYTSQGGSEFELGTFKMKLKVGEKGQILRPQHSPLKDFIYSFEMHVADPSIITFDEKGNWVALKAGTTKVSPSFPTSVDSEQAKKFNEELKAHPVDLTVNDISVTWEVTVEDLKAGTSPVYRLYQPDLKVHLYTMDENEYRILGNHGWKQEGQAWTSNNASGTPVYRLYHPGLKVHLYTMDTNEYKVLATRGWKQEGEAYKSSGSTPVYRLYHADIKKHLYTRDANEKNVLSTRGWKYEGVAWNVE